MSELDDISQIDHIRAATKYVYLLLSRREYSASEVRGKLQTKGYESDVIEPVLADFIAEGLLSDQRFAESYTRYRQAKGFGPVRIQHDLQQRGVKQSIIAQVLYNSDISWDETIWRVWKKRFSETKPADFETMAKQSRFLQYRGFTHEQINALLSNDSGFID
jgi:regulatory protein